IVDTEGVVLPAGVAGEIIVTHLATGDFPFIRYRTGDVGILSDELCSCGRGLPLVKEIQGRTTDFIIAQDGTVLHGLSLIYVLRDITGVESFKITQHTLDKTTVQIVKNQHYRSESELKIAREFRQRLGYSVDVNVEYCPEIAKEKSGKFRYVVSHVQQN
ncbi:MAG: phenylacetate--CoA ligase family protein, partial [Gammaproteobacteria bacterium]